VRGGPVEHGQVSSGSGDPACPSRQFASRRIQHPGAAEPEALRMVRMRVIHALGEIVAEEGLQAASAERVAELASVSMRSFTQLFGDVQGCVQAGCAEGLKRAACGVRRAAQAAPADARHAAGLDGLLSFSEQEPELARLCVVGVLAGPSPGPPGETGPLPRPPKETGPLPRPPEETEESQEAGATLGSALGTVRDVLAGIAAHSRVEAHALGARPAEQRQLERLLARLLALGVIRETHAGWALTDDGHAVLRVCGGGTAPGHARV
jgi:AcrR family transcriptional regulator